MDCVVLCPCTPLHSRDFTAVAPYEYPSPPISLGYCSDEGGSRRYSPLSPARYTRVSKIGSGTYGQVYKCIDTYMSALSGKEVMVAVKISNQQDNYQLAAKQEVNALTLLRNNTSTVKMLDSYKEDGSLCIVFELLDCTAFDWMQSRRPKNPLYLDEIALIGRSVFTSLCELHGFGFIHADCKPENCMLRDRSNGASTAVMIDFGAVRSDSDNEYMDVQTLWYRAPEVMCGVKYTNKIDSWSVGCTLYELAVGTPLFAGKNVKESLKQIISIVGRPSDESCELLMKRSPEFSYLASTAPGPTPEAQNVLDEQIRGLRLGPLVSTTWDGVDSSAQATDLFIKLLYALLDPNEDTRISCTDALHHPFFYFVIPNYKPPACAGLCPSVIPLVQNNASQYSPMTIPQPRSVICASTCKAQPTMTPVGLPQCCSADAWHSDRHKTAAVPVVLSFHPYPYPAASNGRPNMLGQPPSYNEAISPLSATTRGGNKYHRGKNRRHRAVVAAQSEYFEAGCLAPVRNQHTMFNNGVGGVCY